MADHLSPSEVLIQMLNDPLAGAARMEALAAQLLEGARKIRQEHQRGEKERKRSKGNSDRLQTEGGLGDRVTIEVVRAQPKGGDHV